MEPHSDSSVNPLSQDAMNASALGVPTLDGGWPLDPHDDLRFQVSLLRLVYQGSLDGGQRVDQAISISSQIAQIEQLLAN